MRKVIALIVAITVISACSGGGDFVKSPVDNMIRDMDSLQNFTIILFDMNVEGSFSKDYFHKYKIIKEKPDGKPYETFTDWVEVSEQAFAEYENDMGMEIAAKTDGTVTKSTAPPGYSRYVGNEQYGRWSSGNNGTSFWEFYGQYAFMSSMIGLVAGPVYRSSYTDYRSNYRGSRPYYGRVTSTGSRRYGTLSQAARTQNPQFYQRVSSNSALRSRVNNSISRSSGSSRTSRSGSRYGSGSSSRSRSSSSRGGK